MPVEHEYIVWGAIGIFGPLPPEVVRAKGEDAAAAAYAERRGLSDGRTIGVVRSKHVTYYTPKRIVEKA